MYTGRRPKGRRVQQVIFFVTLSGDRVERFLRIMGAWALVRDTHVIYGRRQASACASTVVSVRMECQGVGTFLRLCKQEGIDPEDHWDDPGEAA